MIRRCEGTAVCSLGPLGNLLSVLSAHVLKPLTLCVFASPVSLYRMQTAMCPVREQTQAVRIVIPILSVYYQPLL